MPSEGSRKERNQREPYTRVVHIKEGKTLIVIRRERNFEIEIARIAGLTKKGKRDARGNVGRNWEGRSSGKE